MFRTDAEGFAVCAHRDLSVCPECATHPLIVDVAGAHFLCAGVVERDALLAELAAMVDA